VTVREYTAIEHMIEIGPGRMRGDDEIRPDRTPRRSDTGHHRHDTLGFG
jgi:hypothetical protein